MNDLLPLSILINAILGAFVVILRTASFGREIHVKALEKEIKLLKERHHIK
ncbi:hypothetical protein [Lishizhenia sp.]|uniref:hypothetical protein n=1 Tax=Lishizhenia sp. TaxID=2497594 RepID=UPI00299CDE29|nr:hypothetical protein [Lishizhenia sp.]MDX1446241.1 hypothetical protein [Lishizhenia sp.]